MMPNFAHNFLFTICVVRGYEGLGVKPGLWGRFGGLVCSG